MWAFRTNFKYILTSLQVYQERLLAPRVLHFSRDQLFWECREYRACESYPEGHSCLIQVDEDSATAKFKSLLKASYPPYAAKTEDSEKTEYYEIWWGLVTVYSRTSLTNSLDKLVALSGIVKQISPLLQDTYIAGMWRTNIEKDLTWYTNDAKTRPTVYRAPSWSWASIDSPIFLEPASETLIKVVDVVLHHATEDMTGLVTSGWLDLRGKLWTVALFSKESCGKNYESNSVVRLLSSRVEVLGTAFLDVASSHDQNLEDDSNSDRLFCMPAIEESRSNLVALLLRVTDAQKGIFQRIGITVLRVANDENFHSRRILEEVQEKTEEDLPCLRYKDGLHTIRII
jgi:hypothetical protein